MTQTFCFVSFILITLCVFVVEAQACVCVSDKPSVEIREADAVFIGTISAEIQQNRRWTVTVSRVIKGDVRKTISLYAAMVGTTCETSNFEVNKTYVFFAEKLIADDLRDEDTGLIGEQNKQKIGQYEPRVCSWTTLLSDWDTKWYRERLKEEKDEAFLKLLKGGRKPKS